MLRLRKGQRSFDPYPGWRGKNIYWDFRMQEGQHEPFESAGGLGLGVYGETAAMNALEWRPHYLGWATKFSGTQSGASGKSHYVSYGTQQFPGDLCCVEMAVRFFEKQTAANGDQHRIIAHDGQWELIIQYVSGAWQINNDLGVNGGDQFNIDSLFLGGSPRFTNWMHIIAWSDKTLGGSNARSQTWVDGVPGTLFTDDNVNSPPAGDLRIGHRDGSDDWDGLAGELAFIRVYNDIPTVAQAELMFREPFPDTYQQRYAGKLYSESASDGIDLGDSNSASMIMQGIATDGVQLNDDPHPAVLFVGPEDIIDLGDSAAGEVIISNFQEESSDGVDLGDTPTGALDMLVASTDGADLGDTAAGPLTMLQSATDGADLGDTTVGTLLQSGVVVDGAKLGDSTAAIRLKTGRCRLSGF